MASLADSTSTHSDILPSTIRKRRVIISTNEKDTNALMDAGMDATGDIITDEYVEWDEIDNVEDYFCQEGESKRRKRWRVFIIYQSRMTLQIGLIDFIMNF